MSTPSDGGGEYVAPAVQSSPSAENPHFEKIGGSAAITNLVERFYAHMDTLPEARAIRALHAADLSPMRAALERYLTEWMGGPALYSKERGQPRLRKQHKRFSVGPEERDAWMLCMRRALADVVTDVALRDELESAFFQVAEFLRNDSAHEHHHHGPKKS